jgi:hypothetical protein
VPTICFCSRGRPTFRARCLLLADRNTSAFIASVTSPEPALVHGGAYCVAEKVNSAAKLYLVVESVRPDTQHAPSSAAPPHPDGAGGGLWA